MTDIRKNFSNRGRAHSVDAALSEDVFDDSDEDKYEIDDETYAGSLHTRMACASRARRRRSLVNRALMQKLLLTRMNDLFAEVKDLRCAVEK